MSKNQDNLMTPIQLMKQDQDQLSTSDHNHQEMSADSSGGGSVLVNQVRRDLLRKVFEN